MAHYMVDCFFRDASQGDGFRRESFIIAALSDNQAIEEAKRAAPWKNPDHFQLRKSSRKGDEVLFASTGKPRAVF